MDSVFNPTREVVWYAKTNTATAQYAACHSLPWLEVAGTQGTELATGMGTEKAVAQNTLQQEFSSDATSVSLNEHCDGVTLINIRGTNCMTIADFMLLYDMTSFNHHSCLVKMLAAQLCPTLCDPTDCSPPGSLLHELLKGRILEWVAMLSSRGAQRSF